MKHAARLPSSLNTISISFFQELSERELYELPSPMVHEVLITGIELMSKRPTTGPTGVHVPESQVTYQVESFKGFEVATSQRGIHAVRLILDDDIPSIMWVGRFYKGASITDRLTLTDNVDALEASFDDVSMPTSPSFEQELTFALRRTRSTLSNFVLT